MVYIIHSPKFTVNFQVKMVLLAKIVYPLRNIMNIVTIIDITIYYVKIFIYNIIYGDKCKTEL